MGRGASKGLLPHPPANKQGGERFYRRVGRTALLAETAQSSLTVIFKLVISGLTSLILVVLGTGNLQFQSPFVNISLKLILSIVAAHVLGTVWSSCS